MTQIDQDVSEEATPCEESSKAMALDETWLVRT